MPMGVNNQEFYAPAKSGGYEGHYGRSELEPNTRPAELDEQHGTGELEPGGVNGYGHFSPSHELDGTEIPRRI